MGVCVCIEPFHFFFIFFFIFCLKVENGTHAWTLAFVCVCACIRYYEVVHVLARFATVLFCVCTYGSFTPNERIERGPGKRTEKKSGKAKAVGSCWKRR